MFNKNQLVDESLERYHALIESTNSMVWSVNSTDFGLVTFNSHMKNFYKNTLNIDLIEGLTPDRMLPNKNLYDYWINNYKRVIESGPFETEYEMATSKQTLLISFYPMKIGTDLVGISVFTKDITDLKNAVTIAQDESIKYKMLFDNVHDYVCIIDADTFQIKHFNHYFRETIEGFKNIEIGSNTSFIELVDASTVHKWNTILKTVKENGNFKTQFIMINNRVLNLDLKLVTLKNNIQEIYILGEDVTTKAEYEKKLEENNKKLKNQLRQSINAISKIGEFKDPYTYGHQMRVQALSLRIAEELNLSEDTKQNISFGALIHDIGKLYIASDILNKPTVLSNLEYKLVQTHVMNSYQIACEIEFPEEVKTMILQHHERLDGSGYPNKLTDKDIILESRILAVSDVMEAMIAHRPYRPGLGVDIAIEEIIKYRGVHFDERVVDVCVDLFQKHKFEFPEVNKR